MTTDSLAKAFARLSTPDSRRAALQHLIQELTPYEWRFIQSLTSSRTFQFDIIGHLPAELVSHIFSYLDTSTPWRLQHVGRSRTMFHCKDFVVFQTSCLVPPLTAISLVHIAMTGNSTTH